MRAQVFRLVLPVIAGLIVAGCAGSGAGRSSGQPVNGTPGERQVNNKEAAALNAQLGAEYLRGRRFREAKEKLDRALVQDASNFEANWVMASLQEQLDNPAEADRYYKIALKLQPDNPDLANTYGAYLCKSGKVDDAVSLFEGLTRNKLYRTPWAAATNAAVCLRADKRNADALAYIERALTMKADYVEAIVEKADLQLALGRGAGARQTIDGYLATPRPQERDSHRPDLLVLGVRAALAQGDSAAALEFARQLRRDYPNSTQAAALPQLMQTRK
ncbi:MAG: type IV pilus biogenesis/stability protein PilW [Pseudomonadota bacterium]